MPHIKIKKGHDLKISGVPDKNFAYPSEHSTVAILPNDFRGVKPKLLVKEGDKLKIGSPLFYNKINPDIKWASPGCGKVKNIVYGPRRVIEKIEIEQEHHGHQHHCHSQDEEIENKIDQALKLALGKND